MPLFASLFLSVKQKGAAQVGTCSPSTKLPECPAAWKSSSGFSTLQQDSRLWCKARAQAGLLGPHLSSPRPQWP